MNYINMNQHIEHNHSKLWRKDPFAHKTQPSEEVCHQNVQACITSFI